MPIILHTFWSLTEKIATLSDKPSTHLNKHLYIENLITQSYLHRALRIWQTRVVQSLTIVLNTKELALLPNVLTPQQAHVIHICRNYNYGFWFLNIIVLENWNSEIYISMITSETSITGQDLRHREVDKCIGVII